MNMGNHHDWKLAVDDNRLRIGWYYPLARCIPDGRFGVLGLESA